MLNPLFAGVSPAPKHGPQNAVLIVAPVAINVDIAPFSNKSINTGWEDGYTASENSSFPQFLPFNISAACITLVYVPPEHPAIIPCWTCNFPSTILSVKLNSISGLSINFLASSSTLVSISSRFAFNSSISYTLLGWNGKAIIGFISLKST